MFHLPSAPIAKPFCFCKKNAMLSKRHHFVFFWEICFLEVQQYSEFSFVFAFIKNPWFLSCLGPRYFSSLCGDLSIILLSGSPIEVMGQIHALISRHLDNWDNGSRWSRIKFTISNSNWNHWSLNVADSIAISVFVLWAKSTNVQVC